MVGREILQSIRQGRVTKMQEAILDLLLSKEEEWVTYRSIVKHLKDKDIFAESIKDETARVKVVQTLKIIEKKLEAIPTETISDHSKSFTFGENLSFEIERKRTLGIRLRKFPIHKFLLRLQGDESLPQVLDKLKNIRLRWQSVVHGRIDYEVIIKTEEELNIYRKIMSDLEAKNIE